MGRSTIHNVPPCHHPCFVPESNNIRKSSYLINSQQRYRRSDWVNPGYQEALQQVHWDEGNFQKRGHIRLEQDPRELYNSRGHKTGLMSWIVQFFEHVFSLCKALFSGGRITSTYKIIPYISNLRGSMA
jgi:hypothetical protein